MLKKIMIKYQISKHFLATFLKNVSYFHLSSYNLAKKQQMLMILYQQQASLNYNI